MANRFRAVLGDVLAVLLEWKEMESDPTYVGRLERIIDMIPPEVTRVGKSKKRQSLKEFAEGVALTVLDDLENGIKQQLAEMKGKPEMEKEKALLERHLSDLAEVKAKRSKEPAAE